MRSVALLVVLSIMSVVGCGGKDSTGPDIASVVVTPATATLVSPSETVQLTASAQDASGNTLSGKTFTWSSSDESIATVSVSGLVAAVADGSVTITATTDGVNGTAALTVDALSAILQVVTRATTLLDQGIVEPTRNPAIRSLIVLGAPLVTAGDSLQSVLGRTFVLDETATRYAPDDGRAGAPQNGTRFILYAVEGNPAVVDTPLTEIGYVDVVFTQGTTDDVEFSAVAVVGGATSFNYSGTGSLTGDRPVFFPSAILAGSRRLSATGTISGGLGQLEFTYSDSVRVFSQDFNSANANVGDYRNYQAGFIPLGELRARSFVGSSMSFSDSDHDVVFRLAFSEGTDDGRDSTVIDIHMFGHRGFAEIKISLDGDSTLLNRSSCPASDNPNLSVPCIRIRGVHIESNTLDQFASTIDEAGGLIGKAAYDPGFWAIEALFGPAVFSLLKAADSVN